MPSPPIPIFPPSRVPLSPFCHYIRVLNSDFFSTDIKLARKEGLKETKGNKDTKAPISVCYADDDLSTVIGKLVKTGYHRVWVVDLDRKPLGLLSLTDVFRKVELH